MPLCVGAATLRQEPHDGSDEAEQQTDRSELSESASKVGRLAGVPG